MVELIHADEHAEIPGFTRAKPCLLHSDGIMLVARLNTSPPTRPRRASRKHPPRPKPKGNGQPTRTRGPCTRAPGQRAHTPCTHTPVSGVVFSVMGTFVQSYLHGQTACVSSDQPHECTARSRHRLGLVVRRGDLALQRKNMPICTFFYVQPKYQNDAIFVNIEGLRPCLSKPSYGASQWAPVARLMQKKRLKSPRKSPF